MKRHPPHPQWTLTITRALQDQLCTASVQTGFSIRVPMRVKSTVRGHCRYWELLTGLTLGFRPLLLQNRLPEDVIKMS